MATEVASVRCGKCGETYHSKLRRGKTTKPCPSCGTKNVATDSTRIPPKY